jgi:hypothetical protein
MLRVTFFFHHRHYFNFLAFIPIFFFPQIFFFKHTMSIPPYYTILDPPLPTNLVLSNVRINKKIDIDHKAQLDSLKSHVDSFRDRQSFWIEVAVLDRLHYKNLNQQRPFHRFKRGMELRRLVKRLKVLAIDKELERLYLSFWDAKT